MTVDLIFSFDSEDYETPASDDGELWWAEALRRHGLTGCFNLVGEEARALRDRGRRDVLAALARHEIDYHTNLHSAHPVHVEYLEGMGWDEGVAAVLAREARGVADLRELTGQQPTAYCKPGSCWAPQVIAAMGLLGIPVFSDAPFEWEPGRPMWYCDSLCLRYHTSFDRYFDRPDRRERLRHDVGALLEERASNGGTLVIYTHPCRLITAAFPANFTAGRQLPRSAWQPAPLRPRGQVEALMADFDDFLGWLAAQPDVRVTTYRALYERYHRRDRWLNRQAVSTLIEAVRASEAGQRAVARSRARSPGRALAGGQPGDKEPGRTVAGNSLLEPRQIDGEWLSPAEQLGVLLWAAAWRREHGSLPSLVPVRPLFGPERWAPPADPGDLNVAELLDVAADASATASFSGRIPSLVRVGNRLLGPGTLFAALARALDEPGDRLMIRPQAELPALAQRSDVATLHFRGSWSIFSPDFEAPGIIQLAWLQTWTARPAV